MARSTAAASWPLTTPPALVYSAALPLGGRRRGKAADTSSADSMPNCRPAACEGEKAGSGQGTAWWGLVGENVAWQLGAAHAEATTQDMDMDIACTETAAPPAEAPTPAHTRDASCMAPSTSLAALLPRTGAMSMLPHRCSRPRAPSALASTPRHSAKASLAALHREVVGRGLSKARSPRVR